MSRVRFVPSLLVLCALASVADAGGGGKTLVNVDKNGLAIQGYDPVAYFTQNRPVKGDAQHASTHAGATYRFATAEHKATFDANPAKYAPQFGGFCAYAVSKGTTAKIEPDAFVITPDGRLLLQYDRGVVDAWNKDPDRLLKKAEANWPGIVDKNGK
jgi:YHS domain-containing protein